MLYSSPTADTPEHLPMAEFLTSIHAKMEGEGEEERKALEVPVVKQSKSLIKTRRLLYWAYQVRCRSPIAPDSKSSSN